MSEPTTYEIVIRGRASSRLLRPLIDDFSIEHPADGNTHLVGVIRDASHLHGVLTHLTSVCAALISVAPAPDLATARRSEPAPARHSHTNPPTKRADR